MLILNLYLSVNFIIRCKDKTFCGLDSSRSFSFCRSIARLTPSRVRKPEMTPPPSPPIRVEIFVTVCAPYIVAATKALPTTPPPNVYNAKLILPSFNGNLLFFFVFSFLVFFCSV
ncbi:hypothetical protein FORC087_4528 [Bacillus cereus]|nr:hypothetical protein FORC087_4528 [Bacillus cereus]